MAKKTVGQRVDRLEQVVQIIAEDHFHLEKVVAELATETRKAFDRVAKQFAESDKRARATDERIDKLAIAKRETDKKFDERVDKLVIAIGEFIRRQNGRK